MGNDAGKQLEPNYAQEDFWVCGPNEMDYRFPSPKDLSDEYLTKNIEEKALVEDPEFDKNKVLSEAKTIMKNLWNVKDQENPLYVFYVHNMSPLLYENTNKNSNKKSKNKNQDIDTNNENLTFDACIHASLFRLVDGDCNVYCPKFRMPVINKNSKKQQNLYELQISDIRNAFRNFMAMLHSTKKICPYIVAAQGISSGIMFNELSKFKDPSMQSWLVAAILPGYPISASAKDVWFANKLRYWRTFKVDNSNSYIFEDVLDENEAKLDSFEMINPITFNNELSGPLEKNYASLQRDLNIKESSLQYQICKCDISKNKSNLKGVLLTSNDKRLNELFTNVDSEYLIYWLSMRDHVKSLCQIFYKNTLPALIQKEKESKVEKPADYDDL